METKKKDKQNLYRIIASILMIFPSGFAAYQLFGDIVATAVILFIAGAIVFFSTTLDMHVADIEITLMKDDEAE
jgi:hypothetical protein